VPKIYLPASVRFVAICLTYHSGIHDMNMYHSKGNIRKIITS
jgi:hypothetical protein